jgi:hypothetical protein
MIRQIYDKTAGASFAIETALALVLFASIAGHTAILMLNDGPDNAIKIQATGFLRRYMNPFVAQGFSFFAPIPLERDEDFFIRGEDSVGHWTPWLNVGRYLTDKIRANRLSNFDLVAQSVRNQTIDALTLDDQKVTGKKVDFYTYGAVKYLERTGFSILRYEYPEKRISRVQTGIEQRIFPRFTKRFEDDSHSRRRFFFMGTDVPPQDVVGLHW